MLAALALVVLLAGGAQTAERIADIQVHGNTITASADIVQLAGVSVGAPVDPGTIDAVTARLKASGRFEKVEVLKRFASIADPSAILIVIVVDEGRVSITRDDATQDLRVEKRHGPPLMYLPVLRHEDGYGWTYGVESALPDVIGRNSRLSIPATWGGEKRVGLAVEKELTRAISRVQGGAAVQRRENPFFDEDDDRVRVWARGERDVARSLKVGAGTAWERISFGSSLDRVTSVGVDATYDTRVDPFLARNAVFARAAWDYLRFDAAGARRTEFEARGYLGLIGQSILVARGLRQDSSRPLPQALEPLLGGRANLRGFKVGSAIGDTLVAGSLELRVPLTSPLNIGRLGLDTFIDTGTIYDKGERLGDQTWQRGVGGGIWLSAAVLRINIDVAHAVGGSTRVQFGTSLVF